MKLAWFKLAPFGLFHERRPSCVLTDEQRWALRFVTEPQSGATLSQLIRAREIIRAMLGSS